MNYDWLFGQNLLLTIVVELAVVLILARIWKLKIKPAILIFSGILASVATLPYLWYVLPSFWHGSQILFFGEGLVILTEILIYQMILNIGWRRAIILSVVANLVSLVVGRYWF